MRKTITGAPLKVEVRPFASKPIESLVPSKWVFVDTESGQVYGYNKKGVWCEVPAKILIAAAKAIETDLFYKTPALKKHRIHKTVDPKHICAYCHHLIPGVECSAGLDYKKCVKETAWTPPK